MIKRKGGKLAFALGRISALQASLFMHVPAEIEYILKTLNAHGFAADLVGGCVRDSLLQRTPADYDIATSATPEQVMALFDHTIPTGLHHGTITVLAKGKPVEVTTFRQESTYSDHRHPDAVQFVSTIEEDLARRDFTINAMAWHPDTGLIDPYQGREDLKNGCIRAVGNPDARFAEDALRMLRAYRFAARYGFTVEENTQKAIEKHAGDMKYVARERVRPELESIMMDDPAKLEQAAHLLKPWIPELEVCFRTPQNSPWHYTDVGHHTTDAMELASHKNNRVLWSLLLHDLGKPAAHTRSEDGIDHFKKHPLLSAKIARRVLKAFGFGKKDIQSIAEIVLHHDDKLKPALKTIYKYRIEKGWDDAMMKDFLAVQYGDIMAHSQQGKDRVQEWKAFKDFYEDQITKRPLSTQELAIDGRFVSRMFHLEGKAIGDALKAALEYAFYHPEKNNEEDLAAFLARWLERKQG